MKNRKHDQGMPIGKLSRIADFLPSPDELIAPEKKERITIYVTHSSVAFFKKAANKKHTKYQTIIRNILDRYAKTYHNAV